MGVVGSSNVDNALGEGYLLGGVIDPTATPISANRGSLWLRMAQTTGQPIAIYRKLDNGYTTNWQLLTLSISIGGVPVGDTLNLNFLGSGVDVANPVPGQFDVTVPGTVIEKEELFIMDPAVTFNFKGVGVLVTQDGTDPAQVNVEVPGLVGGGSPFNEKYARFGPRELDQQGNASNLIFKGVPVFSFSNGGTSTGIITLPVINYQVGDDIELDLYWIVDGSGGGGGNRNVFTQVSVSLFQLGDDIDLITTITRTDQYAVSNQDGLTYNRPQIFTAADLGNPVDGDYFLLVEIFRDATNSQDRFNRDLNFYLGRAFWEQ